ncbi:MAG: AI-2E family transporter [Candidatus Pacebacteria bacterium]|nr:AI-2E family transporter [Candidatus Paceibacterota bacterium]
MQEKGDFTRISISTSTIVKFFLVPLFIFLLYILRDLVLVVLTAIVIASFIDSSVPHLKKIGIKNRVFGIVIFYTISILILAGLFYLFAPLLITEIYNFSTFISTYMPNVSFFDFFRNEAFSGAKDIVGSLSGHFSITTLLSISKAFVLNLSGGFVQVLFIAFGGLFNFVLIVLLSFYLSVQEKGIENFLYIIVPAKYDKYIVDLWTRSSRKIGLWVRGQMLLGFVVGVLVYLILSLLGIEYALLLAIITGIMEMVPYGILVAMIPVFAFSYLSNGLGSAFMVAGAYVIVHEFDVFLFTPLIIKKIVGLSPIVIILAVVVGFELGGIWGAILAIPLAVILMEFLNDVEKDKILAKTNNESR